MISELDEYIICKYKYKFNGLHNKSIHKSQASIKQILKNLKFKAH